MIYPLIAWWIFPVRCVNVETRPGNFKVAFLGSLQMFPAEIQDIAVALQCVDPQQARRHVGVADRWNRSLVMTNIAIEAMAQSK